ncbi:MAG: pentapeptide repeat-containing protein [Oscillatoriales cyanobacterium C42_A2020_001]|nr:pentapeptide repeat-containing protein [Leptolyngbyaceae cyanobacterium C42_A2020_001]
MKFRFLPLITLATSLSLPLPAYSENIEHTRQLLSTRQCAQCDLSRAGLVFAELAGANLVQANLVQANLSRANLQGADLRGANLVGVSFNGANLVGARLDGANLTGADLRGAYLTGASLQGAVMEGAYLQGAIGLAAEVGKVEDFYRWAIEDERQKNYVSAANNFTQVIERKPNFAPAFIGRSAARLQGGDLKGAIADARQAETLFTAQGDAKNAEIANKIATTLEKPPEERPKKGGGFGNFLVGLLGGALQLFLTRFPIPFF